MSWLNRVRKAIPFMAKKEQSQDNLWHKCSGCSQMIFTKEWEENLSVCPKCDHHGRIGPNARFEQTLDDRFTVLPTPVVKEDPLKFRDTKKYTDRIRAARAATGDQDALVNAYGKVDGVPIVMGVQNFAYMGGSMGVAVGAAFVQGVEEAIKRKCPYVIFTAAGGARMQEGILSLMQMPRATVAIQKLHDAGLPYIVVLTDPTTGGVTASYAMLGDVQISEPNALIGFAGQRVIENTIREKLPEGFQRAEYLLAHGMIDMVVHRRDMRERIAQVAGYLTPRKAA
ncbi:MAG: acetyl-CoA carboxylase, carboxyltransferase subunit beta [Sphingobium sp.]